jgi:hypothetical protein
MVKDITQRFDVTLRDLAGGGLKIKSGDGAMVRRSVGQTNLKFKEFLGRRRLKVLLRKVTRYAAAHVKETIAYLDVGQHEGAGAKITKWSEMDTAQRQAANPLGSRRRMTRAAGREGGRSARQKVGGL